MRRVCGDWKRESTTGDDVHQVAWIEQKLAFEIGKRVHGLYGVRGTA